MHAATACCEAEGDEVMRSSMKLGSMYCSEAVILCYSYKAVLTLERTYTGCAQGVQADSTDKLE